ATLEVALVLDLGERDAAQRTAQVDADPLGGGCIPLARDEAGIAHRRATRGQSELAEAIEGPGRSRVHVVERVEIVDLGSNLGAERRGVEAVDPLDWRSAG